MSLALKEELREIIAEVTEIDEIPDEASFADLGIDSMMALEIVADVERKYKLSIPEDQLQDLINLNAVYDKVSAVMSAASAS